jgi:hypothetical protein
MMNDESANGKRQLLLAMKLRELALILKYNVAYLAS